MVLSLWFLCALFILMLALRLDDRTQWSSFGVFTPMWMLDAKLLAISGYKVAEIRRKSLLFRFEYL